MAEEKKEVKLNEKTLTAEEFEQFQKSVEGQRDVKIVQTGTDAYRTRIQD